MPPRILTADDNRNVRIALQQLLESAQDIEFLHAENGDDALRKALEFRPEIVILDFELAHPKSHYTDGVMRERSRHEKNYQSSRRARLQSGHKATANVSALAADGRSANFWNPSQDVP